MALGAQRKTMAQRRRVAVDVEGLWQYKLSRVESIGIEEDFRWVFQIER